MSVDELIENFEFLDSWEDKYRYIIDLGEKLTPLDEAFHTEEWKVKGCQSQVWLVPQRNGNILEFRGDSDAMIVKGLIAVVLMIYSGKTVGQIKETDIEEIFGRLGLHEHLSPSRRNGLESMIAKIQYYADTLS